MRLNVIAADRAPTIAIVIHNICHHVGNPFAAKTAPRNANGNAKSVCSNLIISKVVRSFTANVAIKRGTLSFTQFYQNGLVLITLSIRFGVEKSRIS